MAKYDLARWDELDGVVKKVRTGARSDGVRRQLLRPAARRRGPRAQRDADEPGGGLRLRTRLGPAAPRREEIEVGEGMAVRVDPEVTRQPSRATRACSGSRSARRAKAGTSRPRGVRLAPCTRSSSPTRSYASSPGTALVPGRLRARRGRRSARDQGALAKLPPPLYECCSASSSGTSPTRRRRSRNCGATCATSRSTRSRTCRACASRPGSRTR